MLGTRRLPAACQGVFLLVLVGRCVSAADVIFDVPTGQRQLFLDDHGIETLHNLTRTLHQPEKKGAVIRNPQPHKTIQIRTAPFWVPEEKQFRIYVSGTDHRLWVSPDGLHWRPGPDADNHPSMVVYDPHDPDQPYKAARLNNGFAVSADGVQWSDPGVATVSSSDEGNFSYNPKHGLFIHTVKRGGPYGRAVAVAVSKDFKTWDDYGLIFHADEQDQVMGRETIERRINDPTQQQTEYNNPDQYSVQIYNMGVFHYEGLYIGLPSMYHATGRVPNTWPGFEKMHLSPYILGLVRQYGDYTGFYTIQVVCSRDLKNWTRVGNRKAFIETSSLDSGAYDRQTIIGPSNALVRGDELWFYYTGIRQYAFVTSGRDPGYDDYHPDAGAICLATLRKDGFISVDAAESGGSLLTQPFELRGSELMVNVACRKKGQLQVELLNGDNSVLATTIPLEDNKVATKLAWNDNGITKFVGQQVRLRFTLTKASLYSYWIE